MFVHVSHHRHRPRISYMSTTGTRQLPLRSSPSSLSSLQYQNTLFPPSAS